MTPRRKVYRRDHLGERIQGDGSDIGHGGFPVGELGTSYAVPVLYSRGVSTHTRAYGRMFRVCSTPLQRELDRSTLSQPLAIAPHGSRTMGVLTPEERALIDKHKQFYLDLAEGRRKPKTAAQLHFVAVCKGRLAPKTDHERAFLRWKELIRENERAAQKLYSQQPVKNKAKPSQSGKKPHNPSAAEQAASKVREERLREMYEKPHARFVDEPWGTRADWKRDFGRNKTNSR